MKRHLLHHGYQAMHSGRKLVPNLLHQVVPTAEKMGAIAAFGYVTNKYREKVTFYGGHGDLLAGFVLKAAAVAGAVMGKGGNLLPHLNNVGDAGLMAWAHAIGSGWGAQSSGVKRLLIKESDLKKAKAALPDATVLGEIPKAPHGRFMSAAELASLAR